MKLVDLGVTDFPEAYRIQIELVKRISQGVSENTLLIAEHKPVITIGRKGSRDNIFKSEDFLRGHGIEIIETDRGGDVTYHGPGQLIAYPVFKLENESRDIHRFLDFLEEIARHFLMQYDVVGEIRPGIRGAWVKEKKIASIGIGVKKWVSYHGLAINISCDLLPFSFIRPCGIKDVKITSLERLLGYKPDMDDAKAKLVFSFKEVPLLAEAFCKN